MKLTAIKCPECNSTLDIEAGMKFCYCKYCGCKIHFDDGNREITITESININHTEKYIDEAEIEREKIRDRKLKRILLLSICGGIISTLLILALFLYTPIKGKIAVSQGKISAGDYTALLDQDYKTVVAHFEAAGFKNIEVIDLDDSGVLFWKNGKVEQISIAGDTSFWSSDYFHPDSKVVISYH